MTRGALRTLGLALLVSLALGVAAGSLGGLSADLSPDGDGVTSPDDAGDGTESSAATAGDTIDRGTYLRLLAALGATATVLSYVSFPRYRRTVLLASGAGVVGTAGYLLYRPSASVGVPALGPGASLGLASVGAVVGLLAAVVLALWRFDALGPAASDEAVSRDGLAGAGDADADRHPADEPVDGPVRRAWQRMVADLDPSSPGSRTPGEFADAAKTAGREPTAVDRLTRLFRAVRYGRADAEEHAEEAAALAERLSEGEDGETPAGREAVEP